MDSARLNHLEELKGSDYKIAEGRPDIQGWDIIDYKGDKIGRVRDMLFDKDTRKVRYIITQVDGDRDVLIPIGKANLDIPNERVVIPSLTVVQLTGLPSYKSKDLTSEQEFAIRNLFAGTSAGGIISGAANSPYNHQTFYDHDDFDEDRFYDRGDYNDPMDDTYRPDEPR